MPGVACVGISGWTYAPWRGVFYPRGLPHKRELAYVAERMSTVEINGSFYSLQRPSSYRSWYDQTPESFLFAVKGPRFVTHMKKLAGVETPLANFFASGPLALRDKLGPILWQLPPNLGFDPDRLRAFFALLPRSTGEAAWLARKQDRVAEPALDAGQDRPLRHALEVRHRSFVDPGFLPLLRENGIAVVVADTAGRWPKLTAVTADFVYVRLHGDVELYTSGYTDQSLDEWAAQVRSWTADGLDTFVYFDNDVKVRSPVDAMALAARLGSGRVPA